MMETTVEPKQSKKIKDIDIKEYRRLLLEEGSYAPNVKRRLDSLSDQQLEKEILDWFEEQTIKKEAKQK